MDTEVFIAAVSAMRELQKAYFKERTQSRLQECKAAERAVDNLLAEYLRKREVERGQLELFTDPK